MFLTELKGPLEAVLFASGDPISEEQLRNVLQVDAETIVELLHGLAEDLSARKSGLMLQQVAGGWQLVTRPECFSYVEKLSQTVDKKLSGPALETLSIIAFKQPITKQEIEQIRGVHIERTLARLMEMELIAEVGRKAVIGRPILYGTTPAFLQSFGLKDIKDLPELPELDMAAAGLDTEQLELLSEVPADTSPLSSSAADGAAEENGQ